MLRRSARLATTSVRTRDEPLQAHVVLQERAARKGKGQAKGPDDGVKSTVRGTTRQRRQSSRVQKAVSGKSVEPKRQNPARKKPLVVSDANSDNVVKTRPNRARQRTQRPKALFNLLGERLKTPPQQGAKKRKELSTVDTDDFMNEENAPAWSGGRRSTQKRAVRELDDVKPSHRGAKKRNKAHEVEDDFLGAFVVSESQDGSVGDTLKSSRSSARSLRAAARGSKKRELYSEDTTAAKKRPRKTRSQRSPPRSLELAQLPEVPEEDEAERAVQTKRTTTPQQQRPPPPPGPHADDIARAKTLFESSCAAVSQMDSLVVHLDQLTRVVELGVEVDELTRHDEEVEAIEQQLRILSETADEDARQGNSVFLELPREQLGRLYGNMKDSAKALQRRAELDVQIEQLSERIRIALAATRERASQASEREERERAAAEEAEKVAAEAAAAAESAKASVEAAKTAAAEEAAKAAAAAAAAVEAAKATEAAAATDVERPAVAEAARVAAVHGTAVIVSVDDAARRAASEAATTVVGAPALAVQSATVVAEVEQQQRAADDGSASTRAATAPAAIVTAATSSEAATGAAAAPRPPVATAVRQATPLGVPPRTLPRVHSLQSQKTPSMQQRSKTTKQPYIDLDRRQIVDHLCATQSSLNGNKVAKELEVRYGRHSWMSYQSHLRDNLNANRHYAAMVRRKQMELGHEGIRMARVRMLEEMATASPNQSWVETEIQTDGSQQDAGADG